ncbi:MAG: hypothetical protein KGY99_06050 [Phycisphaerae bacterium]|nr:hypothetical protein [Phycisphaerae bacterium]
MLDLMAQIAGRACPPAADVTVASQVASLGAAGVMGAMWLWERRLSRVREQQLTDAHERIARDEQRLEQLTRVVEQNTAAVGRFTETQRQVVETLKDLARELRNGHTPSP